jgi:hypothetical protein
LIQQDLENIKLTNVQTIPLFLCREDSGLNLLVESREQYLWSKMQIVPRRTVSNSDPSFHYCPPHRAGNERKEPLPYLCEDEWFPFSLIENKGRMNFTNFPRISLKMAR